jgi:RNA-directed DNA polymerase
MVLLIDSHPRQGWLVKAVARRVRDELAKLKVEINEEKSRMVDLSNGESSCFLGFEYRLVRSKLGKWVAPVCAQVEKADGSVGEAQDSPPTIPQPACGTGD